METPDNTESKKDVIGVASHALFCIQEWATKEQKKSFNRWLKHSAKSDEGKMHLLRSEVMREVARKITREIRKQNDQADPLHGRGKTP
jgi:superfamily I DNA/RNA helicase